jgi:hypothetical protein
MNKAPKFLNLNTNIYRDERTLILLDDQDISINWSKWDNIVIGLNGYKKWSQYKTNIVGIILTKSEFENSNKNWFEELLHISKKVSVIYVSQKILSIKSEEYWLDNYDNLIHLENASNIYPYIQDEWDHTHVDALAIMSMIMRYNYIVFDNKHKLSDNRSKILSEYCININYKLIPNQCWIFLQYFRHENNRRYKELKECLKKNINNNFIDKIVLINETDYSKEWVGIPNASEKINQIINGKRLTYADFIDIVNKIAPDNCYVILANADIYFGNTLKYLWSVNLSDKMLGLLRWDIPNEGVLFEDRAELFGPRNDSQDSWIFLSNSIKSRVWDYSKFKYQLGKSGCDNRFTSDILRMKFLITNPSLSIKSYHLHNSNIRNYSKSDYIPSDFYVYVEPTRILDMKQITTPLDKTTHLDYLNNESIDFEVKSSSISNTISYCTILDKQGRFKWEPSIENYYFDKFQLYKWKNACVTTNGLVYDLWNIYTGKHNKTHNYWEKCLTDIFTPLEYRRRVLAIPFKDNYIFEKADTYCLEYLSRVARLIEKYPESSFWIPKEFIIYVRQFQWKSDKLQAIEYNPEMACYADEVIGFLPGPHELGKEDIDSLRNLYPSWNPTPIKDSCLIITDNILDDIFIENLEKELGNNWSITQISSNNPGQFYEVVGSQLCIFIGGKNTQDKWSRLWALPEGCCVIEFQENNETSIDGEFQHLAHISGLKSWVYLLDSNNITQLAILEYTKKWFIKNSDELVDYLVSYFIIFGITILVIYHFNNPIEPIASSVALCSPV